MDPAPVPPVDGRGPDPALDALVRPVLDLVGDVTGLESTYLTAVDGGHARHTVLIARNAGALEIPEGLALPWVDTSRALEAGGDRGSDVLAQWGASDAARALGIRTHVACPVRDGDGRLFGMLCGASARTLESDARMRGVMDMAARLIGLHLERARLVADLRRADAERAGCALTDPVTGLPNRRALTLELGRMLARAQRDGMAVFAAAVDLDASPHVGSRHGHDARDRFLSAMAARLEAGLRGGDLVGRLGDGFVVVGAVPRETAEASGDVVRERLLAQTTGTFDLDGMRLEYPGASVGLVIARVGEFDPDALLARADAAMPSGMRIGTDNG